MKKIIIFIIVILLVILVFIKFDTINNIQSGSILNSKENIYFTDKDVHPEIQAELNKQFRINMGQVASFKEGFKVIFIGYQFVSGCGGESPTGLDELILEKAEASQCAPSTVFTKYAVIKDGTVFDSHYEYYTNGYNITTVSSKDKQEKYTDIIVTLVDKKEVEKMQTEIHNSSLEQEAKDKNDSSFCLDIKDPGQKNNCISFVARETYFSSVFTLENTEEQLKKVRKICELIGYSGQFCSIIGKEKVLTPQLCSNLSKNDDMSDPNWKGVSFYEDCFWVSKRFYEYDLNICNDIKWASVKDVCLAPLF